MEIILRPIGIIHSPFKNLEEMPIQPTSDMNGPGYLEVFPDYIGGLKDLEGFSHVSIVYHFHMVKSPKLVVTPFLDNREHGVFSTRAPSRPNPIGLSLVNLVKIEKNWIYVNHLDVLDQTPLLDIKPFVPEFERLQDVRTGWLEQVKGQAYSQKSDSRFK